MEFFLPLCYVFLTFLILQADSLSDSTKLIFRGCANQKFLEPIDQYTIPLNTLFDYLSTQSKNTSFSSTTIQPMFGLYQCRGDLTKLECNDCVNQFKPLANQHCPNSIAARIQLNGCYMRYEITGFTQVSNSELLYKVCESRKVTGNVTQFEGFRDMGFDKIEKGVGNGGFFIGSYESVDVLGQCQGDLASDDCLDCVHTGIEDVKTACGNSVSGQAYLQKCYVSYAYRSKGALSPGTTEQIPPGKEHSTMKVVAIIVGGLAAVGFGLVCVLFVSSIFKKRENSKHGSYY